MMYSRLIDYIMLTQCADSKPMTDAGCHVTLRIHLMADAQYAYVQYSLSLFIIYSWSDEVR